MRKKTILFVMIFFMLVSIQSNSANDVSEDGKTPDTSKTDDSESALLALKKFEKLMLNKEYEKALAILDDAFDIKAKTPKESLMFCTIKYGATVYLNLMLEREETFSKQHDIVYRQILKDHWNTASARWMRLNCKTALYGKLGLPDEIIEECENYIDNDLTELSNYQAYIFASGALLVKGDIIKAKKYLSSAEHILSEFQKITRKSGKPMVIADGSDTMCKLFRYYIQHLSGEYCIELSKEKPDPPKMIFENGEPVLNFKVVCSYEFISRKTGEIFDTRVIIKKIQEEEKPKATEVKP